jgi:hypothetical protein
MAQCNREASFAYGDRLRAMDAIHWKRLQAEGNLRLGEFMMAFDALVAS